MCGHAQEARTACGNYTHQETCSTSRKCVHISSCVFPMAEDALQCPVQRLNVSVCASGTAVFLLCFKRKQQAALLSCSARSFEPQQRLCACLQSNFSPSHEATNHTRWFRSDISYELGVTTRWWVHGGVCWQRRPAIVVRCACSFKAVDVDAGTSLGLSHEEITFPPWTSDTAAMVVGAQWSTDL